MTEVVETTATKESVLSLARAAGEGMRKLDEKYGIGVTSGIYYFEVVPGQRSEGIESMHAKNLTLDFEFGNELNASNSVDGMVRERTDLVKVSTGLQKIVDVTSSPDPSALRDRFNAQIAIVEARIQSRLENRDPYGLDQLVNAKRVLYQARDSIKD